MWPMPTRKRLTLRQDGALVDREGNVWGVLESISITLPENVVSWGSRGGAVDSSSTASASEFSANVQETLLPRGGAGEVPHRSAEQIVWDHYQRVVPGGKRFTLEAKRSRIIRNALAVRPLDVVLAAITGLANSSYHNGQNERGKKYLAIRYALCGVENEANDERIDKMASKARTTVRELVDNLPSAGREMVRDHMRKVAASLLAPDDANLRARAEGSAAYLASTFGLTAKIGDGGSVVWSRGK